MGKRAVLGGKAQARREGTLKGEQQLGALGVAVEQPLAVEARGLTQVYAHGQQRITALDAITLAVPPFPSSKKMSP